MNTKLGLLPGGGGVGVGAAGVGTEGVGGGVGSAEVHLRSALLSGQFGFSCARFFSTHALQLVAFLRLVVMDPCAVKSGEKLRYRDPLTSLGSIDQAFSRSHCRRALPEQRGNRGARAGNKSQRRPSESAADFLDFFSAIRAG